MHRSTKATYKVLVILTRKLTEFHRKCRNNGLKQYCSRVKNLTPVLGKLKSVYARMQALDRIERRLLDRKRHDAQLGISSISLKHQLDDLQEQRLALIRMRNKLLKMLAANNVHN